MNVKRENKYLFLSFTGWAIKAVKFVIVYTYVEIYWSVVNKMQKCFWCIDGEKNLQNYFFKKMKFIDKKGFFLNPRKKERANAKLKSVT